MKYTRWLPNSPQPQVGQCVKMTIGNHMSEIGFKSEACNKKMPAVCQICKFKILYHSIFLISLLPDITDLIN